MQDWKYVGLGIGAVGSLFIPKLLRRITGKAARIAATFDVTYDECVKAGITVKNTGTKDLHLKWTYRYTGPSIWTTGWWDLGTLAPGDTATPSDDTEIRRALFTLGTYDATAIIADFDTDYEYDTSTITGAFRVIEIAKAEITSFSVEHNPTCV